jgi:hypothetical protein
MEIEVVNVDLSMQEISRVVRNMADRIGWEAEWNGTQFLIIRKGDPEDESQCNIHTQGGEICRT